MQSLSILLQEAPADTFGYMLLGLGVILGTMTLYIVSLVSRINNLHRDLEVLDQVDEQQMGAQAAGD